MCKSSPDDYFDLTRIPTYYLLGRFRTHERKWLSIKKNKTFTNSNLSFRDHLRFRCLNTVVCLAGPIKMSKIGLIKYISYLKKKL